MSRIIPFEEGIKEGRKQALEEELKFLENILFGASYCWVNDKIEQRIEQIKKEMK